MCSKIRSPKNKALPAQGLAVSGNSKALQHECLCWGDKRASNALRSPLFSPAAADVVLALYDEAFLWSLLVRLLFTSAAENQRAPLSEEKTPTHELFNKEGQPVILVP